MDKRKVDELLPKAYEVLKDTGIADDKNEIPGTYRSYISTFGAAVSGGSLLAAIAFYSADKEENKKANKETQCDRVKIVKALYLLLGKGREVSADALFQYVTDSITSENNRKKIDIQKEAACREEIINGTIALKLAMNLYKFQKEQEGDGTDGA